MRKVFSLLFAIIMLNSFMIPAFAQNTRQETIEYFEDGSYGVTIIITNFQLFSKANTITRTKEYRYKNSNDQVLWAATITATFTYNGTSATCTQVTKAHHIYNDSWKLTASSASKSGATATGAFTFKHYVLGVPTKTINKTLTLTCDKTGNVS